MKDRLIKNVGWFVVGLTLVGFVLFGLITFDKVNDNIWSLIGGSIVVIAFGIVITLTLHTQAILNGKDSKEVKGAEEQINNNYIKVMDKREYAFVYCDIKYEEALKHVRRLLLNNVGLFYDDYYDDNGKFKGSTIPLCEKDKVKNKLIRKQNKVINKLRGGIKITQITPTDMFTISESNSKDPLKRAKSLKNYSGSVVTKTVITRTITGFISSLYMIGFVGGNFWEILFKIITGIFVISGALMTYLGTYRYMTNGYCTRLNEQAGLLDEFYNMLKSGKIITRSYNERQQRQEEQTKISGLDERGQSDVVIGLGEERADTWRDSQENWYSKTDAL